MQEKIKKVAIEAAKKSGQELLKRFDNFDRKNVKLKSRHEIVTDADLASEKIILKAIKKNFPTHRIFSEEAGKENKQSDFLWIIDPLDGTTNFSMHNPLWSVAFALTYREEIIFSVVYIPVLGELFFAQKDRGSYLVKKGKIIKIKVSNIKEGKVLNAYCHGKEMKDVKRAIKYYAYQKTHSLDSRQLGSASVEMAFVACGRLESIAIPGVSAWDAAPGAFLAREAGAAVTDFSNREWNLKSYDILVDNRLVHGRLLKAWKITDKK